MINEQVEILKYIKNKGQGEIESVIDRGVSHKLTIGEMYEGLTKEILEAIVSPINNLLKLDLKVVKGFISNYKGELSKEIDCMLVLGEGEKLPKIDKYIWNIDNVLIVIQVKKEMQARDIQQGFENLQSVYKIGAEISEKIDMALFEDCYKGLVGEKLPIGDMVAVLPIEKQLVRASIMKNTYLPPRILFGFEGHKTEFGLRECFNQYLIKNTGVEGYSFASFPNLIISGENSLVKVDGLAYKAKIEENYAMCAYASCNENPLLSLLRIILERLSYKFEIDFTGGLDIDESKEEKLQPVLKMIPVNKGKLEWEIEFSGIDKKGLKSFRDNPKV
ncbi:DUF6602 domain-containing protein [Clostridium perfringens]|uniref:DUF6602 domain-containing protein n=1 Tax=Clostridium perfringens TaxID=1502 RepID=UPI0013E33E2B|nr:DUF6602 domain-containing protein [Clostridium perfringens]MCC2765232.1 hypothetical protein [Clostridium perfringens]MCG4542244.1 hypothetical protein [Clostridium perfringens]MCG4544891.1 hypothetical protein [Clostridium perfringens]MCG4553546.1 hypothetical protein [Clostridium perfringens]MCG4556976.1 hypothetical protein [Clostridium perfringens]